jgi:hypothetical protein
MQASYAISSIAAPLLELFPPGGCRSGFGASDRNLGWLKDLYGVSNSNPMSFDEMLIHGDQMSPLDPAVVGSFQKAYLGCTACVDARYLPQ